MRVPVQNMWRCISIVMQAEEQFEVAHGRDGADASSCSTSVTSIYFSQFVVLPIHHSPAL